MKRGPKPSPSNPRTLTFTQTRVYRQCINTQTYWIYAGDIAEKCRLCTSEALGILRALARHGLLVIMTEEQIRLSQRAFYLAGDKRRSSIGFRMAFESDIRANPPTARIPLDV